MSLSGGLLDIKIGCLLASRCQGAFFKVHKCVFQLVNLYAD